jgi:RimJ/RimL family protein N-acetyltransferase
MTYPLLTERLSIEPLSIADLETFVEYRQDPEIARFQSWDTSYSHSQAQELIESQKGVQISSRNDWLQLGIHLAVNGILIGDLAIHRLNEEELAFEIGFTVAGKFQRQGYAKEALITLMDYLIQEVGATKLEASTDRRNRRSIKLLEAVGFHHEQARTYTEEFKGEIVTVDVYETRFSSLN